MPAPREDRAGRFTCHSRSTAFGVMPATDSSEVAVTIPSFVSAAQVAGTSKAKQVPVKVRFMVSGCLRSGSSGPLRCHGSGPVGGFMGVVPRQVSWRSPEAAPRKVHSGHWPR